MDDLPVSVELPGEKQYHYDLGYKLGTVKKGSVTVNNHIKFIVKYHEVK